MLWVNEPQRLGAIRGFCCVLRCCMCLASKEYLKGKRVRVPSKHTSSAASRRRKVRQPKLILQTPEGWLESELNRRRERGTWCPRNEQLNDLPLLRAPPYPAYPSYPSACQSGRVRHIIGLGRLSFSNIILHECQQQCLNSPRLYLRCSLCELSVGAGKEAWQIPNAAAVACGFCGYPVISQVAEQNHHPIH